MADKYLAVQSNKPGVALVTLIDAEPSTTDYVLDKDGLAGDLDDRRACDAEDSDQDRSWRSRAG
jgi:hypothetical protein